MADVTCLVTVSENKNKNNSNRFDDGLIIAIFSFCFDCLLFSHAFEMLPCQKVSRDYTIVQQ